MLKNQRFVAGIVVAFAVQLAVVTGDSSAQALVTDRPDFTESGVTVPASFMQFEGGTTYAALGGGHGELAVGEALLRWGVAHRIELRFGAPSFISHTNGEDHSGLSDGQLGAKIQLGPVGQAWDLAVIATASVPVGDDAFTSNEVDPSFILATGRALGETSSIGGQITAALPTEGSDRAFEWGATIVIGTTLSPQAGVFVELAATVPESGTAPLVGHAGVTHRFSDEFQIDMHAGIGLSDTAPDTFVGIGLARQFH